MQISFHWMVGLHHFPLCFSYVPWQPSLVPNFELSAYLKKVIPETHCVHLIRFPRFYYYHWVDVSASRLLVPEGIMRPVISTPVLAWFHWLCTVSKSCNHYWNLRFPPSDIGDLSWMWLSCSLVLLLLKMLKLFGFPNFWFWAYLMKVISETCHAL